MKTKLLTVMLVLVPLMAFADPTPSPAPTGDKLQVALADMVNKSVQVAGDAKDFLVTQLPDVIQQLLRWKMAESIAYNVLGLLVALIVILAIRKYISHCKKMDWDFYDHEHLIPVTMAAVAVLIAGILATVNLFNIAWLQIWLAPKVYLIEYARDMVK